MHELRQIANQFGLRLIEDACQAIGATYDDQPVGSWGDFGCFSFYPTKNLGACGDGGFIVTDDHESRDRLVRLRSHGTYKKYHHDLVGYNSRLDELQAAILSVKLSHLPEWNRKRRLWAQRYTQAFSDLPVQTPLRPEPSEPVYHLYILYTPRAKGLEQHLKKRGIGCGIYYPLPLHRQKALWNRYRSTPLPVTEKIAGNTLAIPLFPEMTEKEQERVIDEVRQFFHG